jgi:hypothetical protein
MRNLSKIIITSLFILILNNPFYGQEKELDCEVLLDEISESYHGECKDGLAHGTGIAKGIDTYEGKFKNGLPWGIGKYTWENGDYFEGRWKKGMRNGKGVYYCEATEEKIEGLWKEDRFLRELKDPPYNIILKNGITGINFHKDNEVYPFDIEILFQRDGKQVSSVGQLQMVSTSGTIKMSSLYSGFEDVQFPFEGAVEFVASSRFGGVNIRYEVKFEVIEEGSWKVVIRY